MNIFNEVLLIAGVATIAAVIIALVAWLFPMSPQTPIKVRVILGIVFLIILIIVLALIVRLSSKIFPGSTQAETPFIPTHTKIPILTLSQIPTLVISSTPANFVTSTPWRPTTYILQTGEFPACLARRFNVNPDDLYNLNNLDYTTPLQPGYSLLIPQTGSFPGQRALHPHPATYSVKPDETINYVACYFGDIIPEDIAKLNNLVQPYVLSTGQILQIP